MAYYSLTINTHTHTHTFMHKINVCTYIQIFTFYKYKLTVDKDRVIIETRMPSIHRSSYIVFNAKKLKRQEKICL